MRFAFLALGLIGALGCRQILSIDDGRPTLADDAGIDAEPAGDASEAGGPGYCASLDPKPQFCADFDTAARVTSGFTNTGGSPDPFVTGDSTLAFDTANFHSGPRGAVMTVGQLLAPSMASVALVKRFAAPPQRLVFDFWVRIDTEDFREKGQVVMLLSLTFPTGQIAIGRGKDGLSLASFDGATQGEAVSTEELPVGRWKRVSLILTSTDISMQVDGTPAATLDRPAGIGGKGFTYVGLGVAGAVGNMGAFRATFDDVTFTSDVALSE